MGFAEDRGGYWRARYKLAPGKYGTVKDDNGLTTRFRTRREAERAANDAEAKVRAGDRPSPKRMTFGEWVNLWYARQDLAASTMQNYRHHIEEHLLPAFEDRVMWDEIKRDDVITWEKQERAAGYADSSIKSLSTLSEN